MKRFIVCLLLLALLCTGAAGAWAQTVVTDCATEFTLSTITVLPGDQLLLSGCIRRTGDGGAALYRLDTDGHVLSQLLTNAQGRGTFHHTALANDGRIWICSYKDNGSYFDYGIDVVQGNQLADWHRQSMQVFTVTQGQDGILMQAKPDGFHFVFALLDADGNKIWQKKFNGSTLMMDVHAVDDGYLAVGRRMIPQGDDLDALPHGVVMKLSPDGKILWQHETKDYATFNGCTVIDNNTLVLVGTDYSKGYSEMPIDCIIAQYDESGLVWRSDYRTDAMSCAYKPVIAATGDGYLIAVEGINPGDGFRLVQYDLQGQQLKDWEPDLSPITRPMSYELAQLSDRIVLVADGFSKTRDNYMTILHTVELP